MNANVDNFYEDENKNEVQDGLRDELEKAENENTYNAEVIVKEKKLSVKRK